MNLDLDPAQRPLTDTVRRTASLTDVSPRDAFDWCLAHEELGTHLIAPDASQDLLLRAGQSCGQRMTAATEAWAQVLVSHRFATVTMADPVLAMGDRRIDQVGTRPTSAGEQGARTR
jgi:hypothetical protein